VQIRAARADDLSAVVTIDVEAGEMFADFGMVAPALSAPVDVAGLERQIDAERLWVAVEDDEPVGYVAVEVVDGHAHVDQVSVDPRYSRRGVGRSLIEQAADWGRDLGLARLTLTTYAEVPWNAPYYERCGFQRMAAGELTPGLRAIRDREIAAGLDQWPRVAMFRQL
jgi:GNAT superfamily N-acetyltransferase